MYVTTSQLKTG